MIIRSIAQLGVEHNMALTILLFVKLVQDSSKKTGINHESYLSNDPVRIDCDS